MAQIIITLIFLPETRSIKMMLKISLFSPNKSCKITHNVVNDLFFAVLAVAIGLLLTCTTPMSKRFHNYTRSSCKAKSSPILTSITTETTSNYFLWMNRETAWKLLTQSFFIPNGKEIETDPLELSRRQKNKLTEYNAVVKSTNLIVSLPTYKYQLYHCRAEWSSESYLTSLCFRLLI